MPQGPGPTRGDRVLRQLERERKLVIETRDYHGHAQQRPIAQEDAQPLDEWLTSEQQGIVEDALRQFEDGTASNASDWAHDNSVGWQITSRGERIAYETVFLSPEEPTEDDLVWAREVVRRRSA